MFYQNDIELLHVIRKRIWCFKKASVLEAFNIIKTLLECRDNEKVLALYVGGKHVLSQVY